MPRVSVILPVYNASTFLGGSIESLLNQTYRDFELLIVNDGSSDDSEKIILGYSDPRITYIRKASNTGIVETLNQGLSLAQGDYIARMDADDIALPERLELQVKFMDENKDVGVAGTWIEYI